MNRAVTTTGAGFSATAANEFRHDGQVGAHARGEGKKIYQPGAGTLGDRGKFAESVKRLLGKGINFSQLSTVNLDRRAGYARSTTGLTEAIEGSASVIATTVAAGLLESQDPIKAILTTEVHQQEKIIITRTYVVGGGAEITPERAPARAVSVKQDVREVYMARYGGDIEVNLNLFLRPEDAKQDLDLKMGAQTLQLDNKLIELGYEAILAEGTDVVEAIMRSNPAYQFNNKSGDGRQFEMRLAADRVYCTQIFGALAKHAYSVPNLLAAVKYASAYTLGSIENPVVILPHGAPNLLKYARPEAMRYDVTGIPAAAKAPLSMQLDRAFTDPVSGARILVHYPRPSYESGSTQPTVRGGGLSQKTTVYTYYYKVGTDNWASDFMKGGLRKPDVAPITTATTNEATFPAVDPNRFADTSFTGTGYSDPANRAVAAAGVADNQLGADAAGSVIFTPGVADNVELTKAFLVPGGDDFMDAADPVNTAVTHPDQLVALFDVINRRGGAEDVENTDRWALYFAMSFLEYVRAARVVHDDLELHLVYDIVASWIAYDNDSTGVAPIDEKNKYFAGMKESKFLTEGDAGTGIINVDRQDNVNIGAGAIAYQLLKAVLTTPGDGSKDVITRALEMLVPFRIWSGGGRADLQRKTMMSWAVRTSAFNEVDVALVTDRAADKFATAPIEFSALVSTAPDVTNTFSWVREMTSYMNMAVAVETELAILENAATAGAGAPVANYPYTDKGFSNGADVGQTCCASGVAATLIELSLVAPSASTMERLRGIQMAFNAVFFDAREFTTECGIPPDKIDFYSALKVTNRRNEAPIYDAMAALKAGDSRSLLGHQFVGATPLDQFKAAFPGERSEYTFLRKTVCQMSSAVVAAPGGKAGRLLVGYPMTGVSTSTATESARIQLRMHMGAAVTDPESIMICPNVSFEGIVSDDFIQVGPIDAKVEEQMANGEPIDITAFGAGRTETEEDMLAIVHQGATFKRNGDVILSNSGHFGKLDNPKCYERLWGSQVYSNEL